MAPEQQPAALSLASAASMHKLAEMAQAKAAAELPASDALCSRSSILALASLAAPSPSAFENAFSPAASEAAATDATSGARRHHMHCDWLPFLHRGPAFFLCKWCVHCLHKHLAFVLLQDLVCSTALLSHRVVGAAAPFAACCRVFD